MATLVCGYPITVLNSFNPPNLYVLKLVYSYTVELLKIKKYYGPIWKCLKRLKVCKLPFVAINNFVKFLKYTIKLIFIWNTIK